MVQDGRFKNYSLIATAIVMFVAPLIFCYTPSYPVSEHHLWCGIFRFISYYTLAVWFFLFGLRIGEKYEGRISPLAKVGMVILGLMFFANHHSMDLIGRKSDWWIMAPAFLRYWVGQMLYHSVFMILGILIYGSKIQMPKGKALGVCIVGALLVLSLYYAHELAQGDELFTIYFPLAMVPFMISIVSLYKWSSYLNIENSFLSLMTPASFWIYVIVLRPIYFQVNALGGVILTVVYWVICYYVYNRWKVKGMK